MHLIDPDSPHERFTCVLCEQQHELGEHDCEGNFVGWVEAPDGPGFVNREERDGTLAGGAYITAWERWNRAGGVLGPEPQLDEFMDAIGALETSRANALEYFENDRRLRRMISCLTVQDLQEISARFFDGKPMPHPDLN